jgi:transcriptional antiterminator RfaH
MSRLFLHPHALWAILFLHIWSSSVDNRTMELKQQWFVVNTKPKNEERAAGNLLAGSIEALAPRLMVKRYKSGKTTNMIEPMFPGYVFVKFDPIQQYHLVKYTRGVRTIVNFSGKIIPLQEEIIEFIKARLVNGVATVEPHGFKKGERVEIKEGPFKGFSGIFERDLPGDERVAILLDGVNYYARMEIDRGLISESGT